MCHFEVARLGQVHPYTVACSGHGVKGSPERSRRGSRASVRGGGATAAPRDLILHRQRHARAARARQRRRRRDRQQVAPRRCTSSSTRPTTRSRKLSCDGSRTALRARCPLPPPSPEHAPLAHPLLCLLAHIRAPRHVSRRQKASFSPNSTSPRYQPSMIPVCHVTAQAR